MNDRDNNDSGTPEPAEYWGSPPPGWAWAPPWMYGPPPPWAVSPPHGWPRGAFQSASCGPTAQYPPQRRSLPPGAPPMPAMDPAPILAPWERRAYGTLVDIAIGVGLIYAYDLTLFMVSPLLHLATWVVGLVGYSSAIRVGYWVLGISWWVWQWSQRGKTGQSIGQMVIGVRVLDIDTHEPIGAIRSILRTLTHVLDILPLWFGYARPFWDRAGQTWADRIHHTITLTTRPSVQ